MKITHLPTAVIATIALTAGIAACGDDEDTTSTAQETASAEEVSVTTGDTADGYSWEVSPTPEADTKTVTFTNDSKEFHALIFARINEGFTLDEAYEAEGEKGTAKMIGQAEAPPGETAEIAVKKPLEPGEYALICPITGKDGPHYKLGQASEFSIE